MLVIRTCTALYHFSRFFIIMSLAEGSHFSALVTRGARGQPRVYRIAGIFRGYKFSRMDHYKGFRGFYFRGLSSSLLAHAHINMQLYLHTISLESRPSL